MILDAIKNRRSMRKYKSTPIPKEKVTAMLEAAMYAPSACNTRPWRFIAITCRETLTRLADAHNWAKMLNTAPLAIVVVALPATQDGIQNGLAEGYYPQDCGAATQNILLQAEAMGYGTCWCGVYPKPLQQPVREILQVPEGETPFCIIAVGEKDDEPKMRGYYDEAKVTWIE